MLTIDEAFKYLKQDYDRLGFDNHVNMRNSKNTETILSCVVYHR